LKWILSHNPFITDYGLYQTTYFTNFGIKRLSWKKLDPPLKKYHVGFTIIPFIQNWWVSQGCIFFRIWCVWGKTWKIGHQNLTFCNFITLQFNDFSQKSLSFSNSANSFWWEKMLKSQQKIICISLFNLIGPIGLKFYVDTHRL